MRSDRTRADPDGTAAVARAEMTVTLNVKNLERVTLLVWELMALRDEMVVMASPHAARLDSLLERFDLGDDADDRPEEVAP